MPTGHTDTDTDIDIDVHIDTDTDARRTDDPTLRTGRGDGVTAAGEA
jgi:hypothetical protein